MRAPLVAVVLLLGALGSPVAPTPAASADTAAVTYVDDVAVSRNSATLSITVPADVEPGDRLLLFVSLNTAALQVSPPAGWTQLGDRTSRTMRSLAWSRVATDTDPGGSVTVALGAVAKATLQLAAYRGVGPGDLVVASAVDTTTSATRRTPTLTAPDGAWVASYWAAKSAAITSWTAPAGVAARRQTANSGSGRIASLLADSGAPVVAGPNGGLTATSNATSTAAVTWSVALPPAADGPVAAFTRTCTGLSCSFDASPSTVPDGGSATYDWDWGDGSTGAGVVADHDFTAAGSYDVALTVTDGDGATDTIVQSVTVAVPPPDVVQVPADGETAPVAHSGDAADDPAIWVDHDDPADSLVIGNDKLGALEVYDLSGARVQRITTGTTFWGNVDVRQGVTIGTRTMDVVVAYNNGLRTFAVDPTTRTLQPVGDGTGTIPTNGGEGLCAYHSASGALYVFVVTRAGRVREYQINDSDRDGLLQGSLVRDFQVGSEAEGCVADDAAGRLYISEEDVGLWRYGAEPGAGIGRVLVDAVQPNGRLAFDVEGVTIAATGGTSGYVIVSAQNGAHPNQSYFNVYDRETNAYVRSFRIVAGTGGDGCERTDGVAAYAGDLGPAFPQGVFVCQDNTNTTPGAGNQDFKLTRLERIVP